MTAPDHSGRGTCHARCRPLASPRSPGNTPQAGLYILQLLFPNNKAAKEKREESIKLGIVETSVKVLASQKPQDVVSAAHILAVMADGLDQGRQVRRGHGPGAGGRVRASVPPPPPCRPAR